MADITLADYTGYIVLELMKAREMADHYAKAVAQEYAKDPVLVHFSVPRFKTPKMTLTIPVLVSGARFNQVVAFRMPLDRFVATAEARLEQVLTTVRQGDGTAFPRPGVVVGDVGGVVVRPPSRSERRLDRKVAALIHEMHDALVKNPDPAQPQAIVPRHWQEIFFTALESDKLLEAYKKAYPRNELYKPSLDDIQKAVESATVVDRTTIESLLINPETQVVKSGSSDATVFTIQAEIVEENFFIRSVRDPQTGQVTQVVEFE